jgi:hypothetical protein
MPARPGARPRRGFYRNVSLLPYVDAFTGEARGSSGDAAAARAPAAAGGGPDGAAREGAVVGAPGGPNQQDV